MRYLCVLLVCGCAAAQQFTLDQVLSAPFPSDLTASPVGDKVAWASNVKGVRNIRVAEPPAYTPRSITAYPEAAAQDLSAPRRPPAASAIVYARGGTANPALSPTAPTPTIYLAALSSASPRRVGEGESPAVSPKGDRIAFVRRGQV